MSIFSNPRSAAKHEAKVYIAAVLRLLGKKDPLMVLEGLLTELEEHMNGLTAEQIHQPEAPGKWSVLEVVQHLADSELVWAYRLRTVLAEQQPQITGYDQDHWARDLRYREVKVRDALEQLRVLRGTNLRLIGSLSTSELQRAGVHSERGKESIEHMIRLYAGHDIVHLKQIARIRKILMT